MHHGLRRWGCSGRPISRWTVSAPAPRIREMPASDILDGELPPHVRVANPVFERVPHELIECLVTDVGVLHPAATGTLMERLPHSELVAERVAAFNRGG